MTITELRVHMDCSGCESKIRKALQKLDGVDDINIDIALQKVTVMGWADSKKILKTVRKTGKRAELWPYPYNPEYHDYTYRYYHQRYQSHVTDHASSYNYRKHGYNGHDYGYYMQSPHLTVPDHHTSAMFSDENPNACSIM